MRKIVLLSIILLPNCLQAMEPGKDKSSSKSSPSLREVILKKRWVSHQQLNSNSNPHSNSNPDAQDEKRHKVLSRKLSDHKMKIGSSDLLYADIGSTDDEFEESKKSPKKSEQEKRTRKIKTKRTELLEELRSKMIALEILPPKQTDVLRTFFKPFFSEFNLMRQELKEIKEGQEILYAELNGQAVLLKQIAQHLSQGENE